MPVKNTEYETIAAEDFGTADAVIHTNGDPVEGYFGDTLQWYWDENGNLVVADDIQEGGNVR